MVRAGGASAAGSSGLAALCALLLLSIGAWGLFGSPEARTGASSSLRRSSSAAAAAAARSAAGAAAAAATNASVTVDLRRRRPASPLLHGIFFEEVRGRGRGRHHRVHRGMLSPPTAPPSAHSLDRSGTLGRAGCTPSWCRTARLMPWLPPPASALPPAQPPSACPSPWPTWRPPPGLPGPAPAPAAAAPRLRRCRSRLEDAAAAEATTSSSPGRNCRVRCSSAAVEGRRCQAMHSPLRECIPTSHCSSLPLLSPWHRHHRHADPGAAPE